MSGKHTLHLAWFLPPYMNLQSKLIPRAENQLNKITAELILLKKFTGKNSGESPPLPPAGPKLNSLL